MDEEESAVTSASLLSPPAAAGHDLTTHGRGPASDPCGKIAVFSQINLLFV